MFRSLGLFSSIPCPVATCELLGCLFAHPERPVKRRKAEQPSTPVSGQSLGLAKQEVPSKASDVSSSATEEAVKSPPPSKTRNILETDAPDGTPSKRILPSVIKNPIDKRYVARATKVPSVTIRYEPNCPLPHETRLQFLRLFQGQFERIYAAFDEVLFQKLVREHAIAQEEHVKKNSSKLTYRSASKVALVALQKREAARNEADTGIYPTYSPPKQEKLDFSCLVHSPRTLKKYGFITEIPQPQDGNRNEEGKDRICDRCSQRFIVTANPDKWLTCTFHPGKATYTTQGGTKTTTWSCCETSEGAGCTTSQTHVFKVTHPPLLASYHAFRELPPSDSQQEGIEVIALDCEMVYTTAGMELARVSILDLTGTLIFDTHVTPENAILDLNTRFSGITKESLKNGVTRDELWTRMLDLGINEDTIMIGHGLENDLNALRIVHARCVDSALLFPHPRGAPYRHALKFLVKRFLNRDIQMNAVTPASRIGTSGQGHDPAEDAKGALDLVVWKLQNGSKQVGDDPFRGKLK